MSNFELDALRECSDRGAVMMLNLVKFRERSRDGCESGRKAYARYMKAAEPLVEARGGRVVWAGAVDGPALCEGGETDWDWSLLVHYPSRAAFVEMVTSPEYQEANRHRENGVERHLILATSTLKFAASPELEA